MMGNKMETSLAWTAGAAALPAKSRAVSMADGAFISSRLETTPSKITISTGFLASLPTVADTEAVLSFSKSVVMMKKQKHEHLLGTEQQLLALLP